MTLLKHIKIRSYETGLVFRDREFTGLLAAGSHWLVDLLGRVRVDLHIHVDPDLTVARAHAIARTVAERVTAGLGGICEVLVHIGAGARPAP